MAIAPRFAAALAVLASAASLSAQTTFSPKYNAFNGTPGATIQVDLNNDGIPDFITGGQTITDELLSAGGGSYQQEGLPFEAPYVPVTSGDYNNDGNADVFFYDPVGGNQLFYVGYGDGRGDFTLKPTPNLPGFTTGELGYVTGVSTDVNGDGKADFLLGCFTHTNTSSPIYTVHVRLFLNNGNGFTDKGDVYSFNLPAGANPGVPYYADPPLNLLLGDYDSDGHADFALRLLDNFNSTPSGILSVFYGNGAGAFTQKTVYSNRADLPEFTSADINDDGRTDLIDTDNDGSVHIFRSNSGRTFTETTISALQLQDSVVTGYPPIVADFDGNGLKDIGYAAISPTPNSNQLGLRVDYQSASQTWKLGSFYAADTFTSYNGGFPFSAINVGGYNHDAKPDAMFVTTDEAAHQYNAEVLLNTGTHAVGTCLPPVIGIHVCSPGSSSASPVKFSFSATSFYPIRKMEVWVDGVKKSETYHTIGNQAFADVSLAIPAGTHRVSFFSGGYDGSVVKKSVTLTVP
jgi:hypothetical protein